MKVKIDDVVQSKITGVHIDGQEQVYVNDTIYVFAIVFAFIAGALVGFLATCV